MSYLIFISVYIFGCYLVWQIAKKMSVGPFWMAWVPFLNDLLVCRMSGKHFGWWLLYYIPIVNIYVAYVFWSRILRDFKKPGPLALVMFIPGLNLILLILLAFAFGYQEKEIEKIEEEETPPKKNKKITKEVSAEKVSEKEESKNGSEDKAEKDGTAIE